MGASKQRSDLARANADTSGRTSGSWRVGSGSNTARPYELGVTVEPLAGPSAQGIDL